MNLQLLTILPAYLLSANLLTAAVISPEVVKRDVFGAHNYEARQVVDPIDGLQLWFSFDGFANLDYDIRASRDLQNWITRGTERAAGGSGLFVEAFPPDDRRFYQAVLSPNGDNGTPTWPAQGVLFADDIGSETVDLQWPAANDDNAIVAYALYLDGTHLATFEANAVEALVQNLESNTVYEFDLFACDAGGNCDALPTLTLRTRVVQEPYLNAPQHGSVFLSSGEFRLTRTDLAIPAREIGFTFTRTYRSDFEKSGPLGYGWTANVFERLKERPNGDVVWQQGIGRSDTFVHQAGSNYDSPTGIFSTLTKDLGGFFLVSPNGTTRFFDSTGKIQTITTRQGNRLTYPQRFIKQPDHEAISLRIEARTAWFGPSVRVSLPCGLVSRPAR